MRKIFAAFFALLVGFAPCVAFAGSTTVAGKDAGGTTRNFDVTTDGSSNYVPWLVICDATAAANCATVNSSHQVLTLDANSAAILTALGSPLQAGGNIGNISGTISLPTGAATSANQSTEISSLATIASNTGSPVPLGTTGGWTPKTTLALSTTVTSIKSSGGQLGFAQCDNNNAAWSYIQVFNVASGSVTLGSTAPTQVIPIPPNLPNGFVANVQGLQFNTAISVAATTSTTGSTGPGTAVNCTFGYN